MFKVLETEDGLVQVKVTTDGRLLWAHIDMNQRSLHPFTDVESICLKEILNVSVKPRGKHTKVPPATNKNLRTHEVHVCHVTRLSRMRLRMTVRVFFGSETQCRNLADDIRKNRRGSESWGGRHLLVIINPISGKGRGVQIYRNKVEPIFKACEISTHVKVTTRAKEIYQILKALRPSDVDGVVLVGGDGCYTEGINGLLESALTEAGRDVNNRENDLVPSSLPVGVIPAGSGNYIALHMHGTLDVTTAAIHIVRGKTVWTNVVSVHEPDRLVCYAGLVFHFGFIGDVMRHCELSRWMGPARYKVVPGRTLLHRRIVNVDIDMYLAKAADTTQGRSDPAANTLHRPTDSCTCVACQNSASTSGGHVVTDMPCDEDDSRRLSSVSREVDFTGLPDISPRFKVALRGHPGTSYDFSVDLRDTSGVLQDTGDSGSAFVSSSFAADVSGEYDFNAASVSRELPEPDPPFSWKDKANTEKLSGEIYNVACQITRAMNDSGSMDVKFGHNSLLTQVLMKCPMGDFLSHMTKVKDNTPGVNQYKAVCYRELRAFRVALADDATKGQTWYFNADGESITLTSDEFYVRLQPRVIQLFGRVHERRRSTTL